jgi:RES domain-containing protein
VRLYRFGSNTLRPPEEEFDGRGGILAGGRWHIKGKPVVYTSTSEPLALLEKLVHRKSRAQVLVYPLYIANVPDHLLEELPAHQLPHDWRSIYPPLSTQRLGHEWLVNESAVGLLVPSVLVSGSSPEVKNCILNPVHPEFKKVPIVGPIQLAVDPRVIIRA